MIKWEVEEMALNAFGKFIRTYRIAHSLLLKNMADKIGIGSAYLSGMETGSKPIPSNIVEKISAAYNLDSNQLDELKRAVEDSQMAVKVQTNGEPLNQQLAAAFARSIDTLSVEDKLKIMEIVNGAKK